MGYFNTENLFKKQPKPKFELQPTIEQRPFESPAVQSFFKKWCEVNDSIEPKIISRDEWEKKGDKGMLEKRSDGKQDLYIPEDLQLWEMVWVMEIVDRDTFVAKSERQDEAKKKLMALGETFQNAGIYIAQRLNSIKEGREIASALAEEFYNYGRSLMVGEKFQEPQDIDKIASQNLTIEEIETVDRFLAGSNLYESRRTRVEKLTEADPDRRGEFYETERQKTLAQFFRASERAFELDRKTKKGKLSPHPSKAFLKPWQSDAPFHSAFLDKVGKAMKQKIETPKRELEGSIFRRGMELLQKNMPFDTLPRYIKDNYLHWQNGEKTLREALQIDKLKAELETVRQTGDLVVISAKEREITSKIQMAVSSYDYEINANNPSEMVANQHINCVGASTLGGALMREAGLDYLVGDVPEHSILFLVTSDGRIEWRDMLASSFNEILTDEMIKGSKKDGTALSVADIVAFSKDPTPEGLMFDVASERYRNKVSMAKEGQRQYVTVFEPEYGQQIVVLNNTGAALLDLKRYEEAIEAYRRAIAVSPKIDYPYEGLGAALFKMGRYEEAIEAYRRAIAINSQPANVYYNLGLVFKRLGRNKDAIRTLEKFIDLSDKQKDSFWIERAEGLIKRNCSRL